MDMSARLITHRNLLKSRQPVKKAQKEAKTPWPLVRKRPIQTEQPPLVDKVAANIRV
jgi:hypothetical protein